MAVNPLVQRALNNRINQGQPTDTLKMQEALAGAERSAASAWESLAGGGSPVVNARPSFNPMTTGRSVMDAMQGLLGKFKGIGGGGSTAGGSVGALGGLIGGSTGDPKGLARSAAAQRGWTGAEWDALERLVQNESGWRPNVSNTSGSGAYGLFQFMPMHFTPTGYLPHGTSSTVEQQIAAGLRYIQDRYGSPSKALAHWNARKPIKGKDVGHWY